jgi:hypothetical protein
VDSKAFKRWGGAAGLVATGLVAGGILAGTMTASADETTPSAGTSSQSAVDPSRPQRSDEQLLTGDTKTKVEAAVLAKYPGATIQRTETDSDGVYESHIVTSDGQQLIVQVGADFAVTGTDSGHGGGPRGGGPTGGATGESGGA